jgi:DNA-binding IclR family transcriptional regulator
VTVHLTSAGRAVLAEAVPAHASAVRRHLLSRLTAEQQRAIVALAQEVAPVMAGGPLTTSNCNSNTLPKISFVWYC